MRRLARMDEGADSWERDWVLRGVEVAEVDRVEVRGGAEEEGREGIEGEGERETADRVKRFVGVASGSIIWGITMMF